jgi:hypothetical protein
VQHGLVPISDYLESIYPGMLAIVCFVLRSAVLYAGVPLLCYFPTAMGRRPAPCRRGLSYAVLRAATRLTNSVGILVGIIFEAKIPSGRVLRPLVISHHSVVKHRLDDA